MGREAAALHKTPSPLAAQRRSRAPDPGADRLRLVVQRQVEQGRAWLPCVELPEPARRAKSAEGVGFEPTEALRLQRFSRPPHSTALPPLRGSNDAGFRSPRPALPTTVDYNP